MKQALTRRHLVKGAGCLLAAPWVLGPAQAQTQAASAKIYVGFNAGGMTDTIARRIADKLTGSYAKTVVVENRSGAGGQIAIAAMKQAPADGSVLLISPMGQLAIFPHVYANLQYNSLTDLEPISVCTEVMPGLAVGSVVPASITTVPQFFAWCKANPQLATYGSPGAGTASHFMGEILARTTGTEFRHVAYRGSLPAIQEAMGGQLAAVSTAVNDYLPFLEGGRIRLLGTAGSKRNRFTPNVPTLQEQGYKDIAISEWFGVFAPAKTPAPVVAQLNQAVAAALKHPDIVSALEKSGMESISSTAAELKQRLQADHAFWGKVVKDTGFKLES